MKTALKALILFTASTLIFSLILGGNRWVFPYGIAVALKAEQGSQSFHPSSFRIHSYRR